MSFIKKEFEKYKEVIPNGVCSSQRHNDPRIFVKAKGAYIWDSEGKQYTDYHAAFAPMLLGHNDNDVNDAIMEGIRQNYSLFGSGASPWEEGFARLIVESVPGVDKALLVNTGSEATYFAIRVARSATKRDKIIIMQGGYNGWHNDVAFNLQDPWEKVSSYKKGEPMELFPFSSGIPSNQKENTAVVQYNDLEAVENLMKTGEIAGIICEPILQNIGIVKPEEGYLQGLRDLCDKYESVLIFDEVKTGFRYSIGGYQSICNVVPDLSTFGKAVANGYPLGVIGGKEEFMKYFSHSDKSKQVLVAGTFNGHFIGSIAGITTLTKLRDQGDEIYGHLDKLGSQMEAGLESIWSAKAVPFNTVRQGSVFTTYFMENAPKRWNDIAKNHDTDLDLAYRKKLVNAGLYFVPMPAKQCSISFAHTKKDIDNSLEIIERVVKEL